MSIKDLKSSFESLKQRVLKTEGQKAAAEVNKIILAINEAAAEKNNADKYKLAIQKVYNAISKAEDTISKSENLADLQSLVNKLSGITIRVKDSSQAENEKNLQEIIKGFPYHINLLNQEIAEMRVSNRKNGFKYNDYINNLKNAKKILEDAITIAKTYSFSLSIEYDQEDNDKDIAAIIKKMSRAFKDIYKKIEIISKKFEYIPDGLDERFELYFNPLINARP